MLVITLLLSLLSAYAYRVGGMSYEEAQKYKMTKWLPKWVKGWFRDINCLILGLLWCILYLPMVSWWRYLIMAILFKLAISTYHDTKPYNWMKPDDNFYLHGFGIGLSFLPIAFNLYTIVYAFLLGGMMGMICENTDEVNIEETARGGLIIALLPILITSLI